MQFVIRWGFALFLLAFLVLLYCFGEPLLLAAALLLIFMIAGALLLLRHDAMALRTELTVQPGVRQGEAVPATVTVLSKSPLFVVRSVMLEIEVRNEMFGTVRTECFRLPLTGRTTQGTVPIDAKCCGLVTFTCRTARAQDVTELFYLKTSPFAEVRALVYPRRMPLQVEISQATRGTPTGDGTMQNRKGNDPSEMFDIREYRPGDDIRSIHWKLSAKAGELILRQPGDPSHYNMLLLPDLGLSATPAELNAAAACCRALLVPLLEGGIRFCAALPGAGGLTLYEITNTREADEFLACWLSCPLQKNGGDGLRYFVMEHLQLRFTRLLVLSAAGTSPELPHLDGQINVLAINFSEATHKISTVQNGTCEIMQLPTAVDGDKKIQVLC